MTCNNNSKTLCGNCTKCYERSFATHPRSINWSDKNKIKPYQVHKSSNKKFYFNCKDCEHELFISLTNIIKGQWCGYCKGNNICLSENCKMCFEKSFASQPMSIMWSFKNDKNPREILKGSETKYLFECTECKHEFQTALFSIKKDKHCPYCSNKKLCEDDSCQTCYNKSCASHIMAQAWSSLNDITPNKVFLQSNKKMKFNCLKCNHLYETQVLHYYNRNGSCPYCANKYLCNNNKCKICFEKSFASHPKINCWSDKNDKLPRNIFKGSETKYIFNCDKCNSEFESKMYNVLTGYWCPYCKNKSEAKVLTMLKESYPNCKTQIRFDWCRYSETNNIMPFDFGIIDSKILIELDGEQHFNQISNWNSPESVQLKDNEKMKYAIQHGYSIIHIYQVDVWSNTNNYDNHIKYMDKSIPYVVINPF